MPTLFDPEARAGLLARFDRLSPDHPRQWGTMSHSAMVAHCAAQLRMSLGELPARRIRTPFGLPLLRQLAVFVIPWPRGVPTAPELKVGEGAGFEADRAELRALIERFGQSADRRDWPVHAGFGPLSARAYGVLAWRHLDHHLRQFGA